MKTKLLCPNIIMLNIALSQRAGIAQVVASLDPGAGKRYRPRWRGMGGVGVRPLWRKPPHITAMGSHPYMALIGSYGRSCSLNFYRSVFFAFVGWQSKYVFIFGTWCIVFGGSSGRLWTSDVIFVKRSVGSESMCFIHRGKTGWFWIVHWSNLLSVLWF